MTEVIGVRFKQVGKIYYFSPNGVQMPVGEKVIVETARGIECGEVAISNRQIKDEGIVKPLKTVIRVANKDDLRRIEENKVKEKKAFKLCLEKIEKHKLQMKLVDVEYTFDNNKILFYFTADGRVDFRELVKDLASVFKTRIELRQIGVRDEENAGRPWNLRAAVLLFLLPGRVPAGLDQDGQGAGAFAQSDQNLRHLRQADVLLKV